MTDKNAQIQAHNEATSKFIDLANKLANEDGVDVKLISAALMAASGIYATFTTAGNNGFLGPGGVKQVADMYKKNLAYIQDRKRQELEAQGLKPRPVGQPGETLSSTHPQRTGEAGDPENPDND